MRPVFKNADSPSVTLLRNEVRQMADSFGELASTSDLGAVDIGVTETRVPHGQRTTPLGFVVYRKTGPGDVYEVRAPDSRFFYLTSSVAVTAYLMVV
jgi:hypothetical protein